MEHKIVIIGAGAIGRAIEHLLKGREVGIEFWDKDPHKVPDQKTLESIVPSAEVLFLCVPSWCLREALQEVKPFLKEATVLVGISKGLEQASGKRPDQLIEEECPGQPFALILGPMLAKEIQEGQPAYAVVAGKASATKLVEDLFEGSKLILNPEEDVASSALAGVLKNVYTLLLGIATGLGYGQNVKGFLVQESLREMQAIASKLQLDFKVMLGMAGAADFMATGFSENSQNFRLGKAIAEMGKADFNSEGKMSAEALIKLLNSEGENLPLLNTVGKILQQPEKTKEFFEEIL